MKKHRPRNVLIDVYGFENRGDQLMVEACFDQIRARLPDSRIAVPGAVYERAVDWFAPRGIVPLEDSASGAKPFFRRMLRRVVGSLIQDSGRLYPEQIDLVLVAAGYHFGDPFERLYADGRLEREIAHFESFSKKGRRIVFLPQSLGPFRGEQARRLLSSVLPRVDMLFARDGESLRLFREAFPEDGRTHVSVAPDFTCLCRPGPGCVRFPSKCYAVVIPNVRMVDSSSREESSRYEDFMVRVCETLAGAGTSVVLLNHEGSQDERIVRSINQRCGGRFAVLSGLSGMECKAVIGDAAIVVSSRFHGVVDGLTQGVPTLGTGWSHKYAELFAEHGCPGNVLDVRDADGAASKILDALRDPDRYASAPGCNARIRDRTLAMWDEVFDGVRTDERRRIRYDHAGEGGDGVSASPPPGPWKETAAAGPKVSVVVPVYNVKPYLRACLDSIRGQTLSDWECICVDDGSSDGSEAILGEYAERDSRFRVIRQANAGPSAARNAAIAAATGEFLYCCDSDDEIEPETLETLVGLCERNTLDQIVFTARVLPDGIPNDAPVVQSMKGYYHLPKSVSGHVRTGPVLFSELVREECFTVSPPFRLIRRDSLPGWLRFPDGLIHEDHYFTPLALVSARRAMVVREPFYRRRIREGSIMTTRDDSENRARCLLNVWKLLGDDLAAGRVPPHAVDAFVEYRQSIYRKYLYYLPWPRPIRLCVQDTVRSGGANGLFGLFVSWIASVPTLAAAVLSVALACSAFRISLETPFRLVDDFTDWTHVSLCSWKGLHTWFMDNFIHSPPMRWRPFFQLENAVSWFFLGNRPAAHHALRWCMTAASLLFLLASLRISFRPRGGRAGPSLRDRVLPFLVLSLLFLLSPNRPDARLAPQEVASVLFLSACNFFALRIWGGTSADSLPRRLLRAAGFCSALLLLAISKETCIAWTAVFVLFSFACLFRRPRREAALLLAASLGVLALSAWKLAAIMLSPADYGHAPITLRTILANAQALSRDVFYGGVSPVLWTLLAAAAVYPAWTLLRLRTRARRERRPFRIGSGWLFVILLSLEFASMFSFLCLQWRVSLRYWYPLVPVSASLSAVAVLFLLNKYGWRSGSLVHAATGSFLLFFVLCNGADYVHQFAVQKANGTMERRVAAFAENERLAGRDLLVLKPDAKWGPEQVVLLGRGLGPFRRRFPSPDRPALSFGSVYPRPRSIGADQTYLELVGGGIDQEPTSFEDGFPDAAPLRFVPDAEAVEAGFGRLFRASAALQFRTRPELHADAGAGLSYSWIALRGPVSGPENSEP